MRDRSSLRSRAAQLNLQFYLQESGNPTFLLRRYRRSSYGASARGEATAPHLHRMQHEAALVLPVELFRAGRPDARDDILSTLLSADHA